MGSTCEGRRSAASTGLCTSRSEQGKCALEAGWIHDPIRIALAHRYHGALPEPMPSQFRHQGQGMTQALFTLRELAAPWTWDLG